MEDIKSKVVAQIEYYFSDENLIRGKFLRKKIEESDGGWISINVLTTFKRLAAISTNKKFIGKALFQSKLNGIEVSTDRQKVRRKCNKPPPVKNNENKSQLISRSAYVEGFAKSMEINDLIEFFSQYSASHVIVRKYLDKTTKTYKSKGSAFVTFSSDDQCDNFLKKSVVIDGITLTTMHQKAFIDNQKITKFTKKMSKHD